MPRKNALPSRGPPDQARPQSATSVKIQQPDIHVPEHLLAQPPAEQVQGPASAAASATASAAAQAGDAGSVPRSPAQGASAAGNSQPSPRRAASPSVSAPRTGRSAAAPGSLNLSYDPWGEGGAPTKNAGHATAPSSAREARQRVELRVDSLTDVRLAAQQRRFDASLRGVPLHGGSVPAVAGAPISVPGSIVAPTSGSLAGTASDAARIPRNVSFSRNCAESTAYQEHNPPTVLRQTEKELEKELSNQPGAQAVQAGKKGSEIRGSVVLPGHVGGGSAAATVAAAAAAAAATEEGVEGAGTPNSVAANGTAKGNKRQIEKKDELHILIGVTGSVATIKLPLIVRKLKQIYGKRAHIQVMMTKASTGFLQAAQEEMPKDVQVWHDEDEWKSRTGKADNSLHVQLRRWADVLLVAPCSANTLAKFAYGICDNLITSVFRVWNPQLPVLLAPAMNTLMYTNPVTKRHLLTLKEAFPFVEILKPIEKVLMCGDIGMGGMREWSDIVSTLVHRLGTGDDDDDDDDDEAGEDSDAEAGQAQPSKAGDAPGTRTVRAEPKRDSMDSRNSRAASAGPAAVRVS